MGLLTEIQAEIEARSLSRGGWAVKDKGAAAIETTSYALMALAGDQEVVRRRAIAALLRTQNGDGSWPAFEGDDQEGCWTTSLALIALRFVGSSARPIERGERWLLNNKAARVIGSGNGSSERSIALYSLIRRNMDGHGFLKP